MKNEQKSENDTMLKKKITFCNFASCDIHNERGKIIYLLFIRFTLYNTFKAKTKRKRC